MQTFLVAMWISLASRQTFTDLIPQFPHALSSFSHHFQVLRTGYINSRSILYNVFISDDTLCSLFPLVVPLELDYIQYILGSWLLLVRPEVVPSFRLASDT